MSVRKVNIALLFVAVPLIGLAVYQRLEARAAEARRLHDAGRVVAHDVAGGRGVVTLLSPTYTIDRIYPSMHGPRGNQDDLHLADATAPGGPELFWLTGISSTVVGRDGESAVSQEFFCHSNLTLNPDQVNAARLAGDVSNHGDLRLFTLIPGRTHIALPDGFGLPVYADEPLDYFSMSLNLNLRDKVEHVRLKTAITYERDGARAEPLVPLYRRALYAYEPMSKSTPAAAACAMGEHLGESCGPAAPPADGPFAASRSAVPSVGVANTVHWLVDPGPFVSRIDVTEQLGLSEDTTAHYVTAHLHPYGKSVELYDATAGTVVFSVRSEDLPDRLGVSRMEQLSLPEGVPLYADHRYELVTRYENTTDHQIDAMSILYVYAVDKAFVESRRSQQPPRPPVARGAAGSGQAG